MPVLKWQASRHCHVHDWAHVIGLGLWIPLFVTHVVIPLFVAIPVYRHV